MRRGFTSPLSSYNAAVRDLGPGGSLPEWRREKHNFLEFSTFSHEGEHPPADADTNSMGTVPLSQPLPQTGLISTHTPFLLTQQSRERRATEQNSPLCWGWHKRNNIKTKSNNNKNTLLIQNFFTGCSYPKQKELQSSTWDLTATTSLCG